MSLSSLFHSVATGPERRRKLLTPVGLLVFGAALLLIVLGGIYTDRGLGLRRLLPGLAGDVLGAILLVSGVSLMVWCVLLFVTARGTPVPFNPPRELIAIGPYARVRNPMLTGVFASLFGLGFLVHSPSIVFVWTPLFMLINAIELKLVEEPELEHRFGDSYRAYRRRVPMFIPRISCRGGRERSPPNP